MIKFKNLLIGFFSIIVVTLAMQPVVLAQNASDQDPARNPGDLSCSTQRFLTFPAWYRGVVDNQCNIKSPSSPEFGSNPFAGFIWRIVLNLVEIILQAVGYAAVGFIIYGGYKYMISAGSPDGMVAARKTIMNAAIGLVLSIAAVAIVNTIANAF